MGDWSCVVWFANGNYILDQQLLVLGKIQNSRSNFLLDHNVSVNKKNKKKNSCYVLFVLIKSILELNPQNATHKILACLRFLFIYSAHIRHIKDSYNAELNRGSHLNHCIIF